MYRSELTAKGVAHVIPDPQKRQRINAIIFDELVYGRIKASSRSCLAADIGRLKDRGSDAVVLGCTKLPLLISEGESPLPTLDSTRLFERAALRPATHQG